MSAQEPQGPIGEPFSAWPEFVREAEAIVQAARERELHLRLLGALAVIKQCPNHVWLLEKTNRVLTDLDFMGYETEIDRVERMFADLGYEVLGGRGVTMDVWVGRRIFHDPAGGRRRVDVFLDRLDFCHPIDLRGRLDLDPVTIPLTDLLLEKLQIVEINEKDLKDLVVLFLEHPVADHETPGAFDGSYVAKLLAKRLGIQLHGLAQHRPHPPLPADDPRPVRRAAGARRGADGPPVEQGGGGPEEPQVAAARARGAVAPLVQRGRGGLPRARSRGRRVGGLRAHPR
ncbi:MAG: hypothetical protein KatS3mg013_1376 [Actinomycetota bacterium]|nr:MAG: hypothetical protein KatS3mg013_1376 [Actinomycetota bacterium]